MIFCDIQHAECIWPEFHYALKLKRRNLGHHSIPRLHLHGLFGYGYSYIAKDKGILPRRLEKLACECGGGGFAVGAAYADKAAASAAVAIAQLYLAYYLYAHLLSLKGKGLKYGNNRAQHQHIHTLKKGFRILAQLIFIFYLGEGFLKTRNVLLHVVYYHVPAIAIKKYGACNAALRHAADKGCLFSVCHKLSSR